MGTTTTQHNTRHHHPHHLVPTKYHKTIKMFSTHKAIQRIAFSSSAPMRTAVKPVVQRASSTHSFKSFGHYQCHESEKVLFFVNDSDSETALETFLRRMRFVEMKPKQGHQYNFFVPQNRVEEIEHTLRQMGY